MKVKVELLLTLLDAVTPIDTCDLTQIVETAENPSYPQMVLFQLTGDRCQNIDPYKLGDNVTVEFNVRGREWQSPSGEIKYFNSLDAWTVTSDSDSATEQPTFEAEMPWPENEDVPF